MRTETTGKNKWILHSQSLMRRRESKRRLILKLHGVSRAQLGRGQKQQCVRHGETVVTRQTMRLTMGTLKSTSRRRFGI